MPSRPASSPAHKVRIIGGLWKRTPLPVADLPGLRPTPDRVRETLFNWLTHGLGDFADCRFLDLFAGTGALGFEAASRGAPQVVLVERHPELVRALHATRTKLDASAVQVVRAEALHFLTRCTAPFDVVFLDPPFGEDWLDRLWPILPRALKPRGWLYVEAETALTPPAGYTLERSLRAGLVHAHLLRLNPAE